LWPLGARLHDVGGVHHDRATALQARRSETLDLAYQRNPERFVRVRPQAIPLPEAVWIHPCKEVPASVNVAQ
jgi:hypothetical protein